MDYPRVLIFGQPFNNIHGGGITLTNLFKGWDKSKIAVADSGHMMNEITRDVCDIYYQLGNEEYKWLFPFNLIQKKYKSGLKSFSEKDAQRGNETKNGIRYKLVNSLFYPLMQWLGLFYCVIRIKMSSQFRNWLTEFNPDVLYVQVTTRESILFVAELIEYLKIPAAIHFMDDWPSTIIKPGLFKNYWKNKIDSELKVLLGKVDLHLSISDSMSVEYKKRYGKEFRAFHNPIDTGFWLPHTKNDFSIDKENVKILCSGRIGQNGISESLIEVASAIDKMNRDGLGIKLHIQTSTREKSIINRLNDFHCVTFNAFVNYTQLPEIFSDADILLLANDFDSKSISYLRYSMPTKASEYMISGTPVLVYTSGLAAVSVFFSEHQCGYCISNNCEEEIIKGIRFLIVNKEYRRKISNNAVNTAIEKFDAIKVRNEFQNLLSSLTACREK
ncbi:MAG: glycosyltransferase [Bacteroidales bacterium]|nr:glycosyltransferase [Bacteroidales bacterium]